MNCGNNSNNNNLKISIYWKSDFRGSSNLRAIPMRKWPAIESPWGEAISFLKFIRPCVLCSNYCCSSPWGMECQQDSGAVVRCHLRRIRHVPLSLLLELSAAVARLDICGGCTAELRTFWAQKVGEELDGCLVICIVTLGTCLTPFV